MNFDKSTSRRDFLKTLGLSAGLLVVSGLGQFASAEEKKKKKADGAAAELPADPKKGKAKELNYVDNKSQVTDAKLKIEKMGTPFNDQTCKNCALYQPKAGGTGVCMLMQAEPAHIVKDAGWCTSWVKKA